MPYRLPWKMPCQLQPTCRQLVLRWFSSIGIILTALSRCTWLSLLYFEPPQLLLLMCQVLLQIEVSNTSTWADAAFVTGSGKRIKAVLLHQVRPLQSATWHFLLQIESHTDSMYPALWACKLHAQRKGCNRDHRWQAAKPGGVATLLQASFY